MDSHEAIGIRDLESGSWKLSQEYICEFYESGRNVTRIAAKQAACKDGGAHEGMPWNPVC